jgi:hypothetical protein
MICQDHFDELSPRYDITKKGKARELRLKPKVNVKPAALYDIPSPITRYTTLCDNDYADLVPMYEITRTINVGWWGLELRQRHSKKAIK